LQSWESPLISHRAAPPGFYRVLPPIKYSWEDAHSWETPSPGILPFRVPAQGSHQSYFVHMFYLAYINIILLARSKSVTAKMLEIKYKRNTRPCGTSNAFDPAKRGPKRTRIELTMLDFRSRGKRACQPSRGLMGMIAPSFSGTRDTHCSPQAHPFASRLGDTQVSQGLALINILFTNMYLGSDTTPVSLGVSPVALTPGWGGGRNPYCACYR